MVLEGKDIGKKGLQGSIVQLAKNCAEIALGGPVDALTNLKMNLGDVDKNLSVKDFYGKVVRKIGEDEKTHLVHFTSIPPTIDAYFQAYQRLAV